ncbi:DUF4062 domain-containing protein [Pseudomonas sp. H11T01]|uniref:DUF4062 domain-containing protein n=1 Tax=Pseudomonas sp. H11T01 TaxID=3402749 RepID=UPI003AD1E7D5
MDKRYQVFISSTYTDLREERQLVSQTLMELNCIPAGMELFPATDEEQFSFIKNVIDDSDYYLLIIGGRYGTVTEEGISYTEKEYDYAVDKGKPVVALLHGSPNSLSVDRSEITENARAKLNTFRERVSTGRLVRYWTSPLELQGHVAISMTSTIARIPAPGWVRGSAVASVELLQEINELRKQNEILKAKLEKFEASAIDLGFEPAGLDELFVVHGSYFSNEARRQRAWESKVSWKDIFYYISPYLLKSMTESKVSEVLRLALLKKQRLPTGLSTLEGQDFQTISVQLKVLGIVDVQVKQASDSKMYKFWSLTSAGEKLMYQMRAVPATVEKQESAFGQEEFESETVTPD